MDNAKRLGVRWQAKRDTALPWRRNNRGAPSPLRSAGALQDLDCGRYGVNTPLVWVLRCFRWNGYLARLKNHPPSGASALGLCRFPASRLPLRTQLGAPKNRAPGGLILQARTIPSREPHRSLPVAPLIADKRCYGEATVWLRCGSRAAPVRRTLFHPFHRKQRRTGGGSGSAGIAAIYVSRSQSFAFAPLV